MSGKRKAAIALVSFLLFLTLAFIWGNSALNAEISGKEPEGVYHGVKPVLDAVFGTDAVSHGVFRKLAHGAEFFVLGAELCFLFFCSGFFNEKNLFAVLSCGLFAAVADESIQLLSLRGASVADILIDFGGALSASVIFYIIYKAVVLTRRRNKKNNKEASAE